MTMNNLNATTEDILVLMQDAPTQQSREDAPPKQQRITATKDTEMGNMEEPTYQLTDAQPSAFQSSQSNLIIDEILSRTNPTINNEPVRDEGLPKIPEKEGALLLKTLANAANTDFCCANSPQPVHYSGYPPAPLQMTLNPTEYQQSVRTQPETITAFVKLVFDDGNVYYVKNPSVIFGRAESSTTQGYFNNNVPGEDDLPSCYRSRGSAHLSTPPNKKRKIRGSSAKKSKSISGSSAHSGPGGTSQTPSHSRRTSTTTTTHTGFFSMQHQQKRPFFTDPFNRSGDTLLGDDGKDVANTHLVEEEAVIHLPPSGPLLKKNISRRHARLRYNFEKRIYEFQVIGKNGAFVEDEWVESGTSWELDRKGGHVLEGSGEVAWRIQIGGIGFKVVFPLGPTEADSGEEGPMSFKFLDGSGREVRTDTGDDGLDEDGDMTTGSPDEGGRWRDDIGDEADEEEEDSNEEGEDEDEKDEDAEEGKSMEEVDTPGVVDSESINGDINSADEYSEQHTSTSEDDVEQFTPAPGRYSRRVQQKAQGNPQPKIQLKVTRKTSKKAPKKTVASPPPPSKKGKSRAVESPKRTRGRPKKEEAAKISKVELKTGREKEREVERERERVKKEKERIMKEREEEKRQLHDLQKDRDRLAKELEREKAKAQARAAKNAEKEERRRQREEEKQRRLLQKLREKDAEKQAKAQRQAMAEAEAVEQARRQQAMLEQKAAQAVATIASQACPVTPSIPSLPPALHLPKRAVGRPPREKEVVKQETSSGNSDGSWDITQSIYGAIDPQLQAYQAQTEHQLTPSEAHSQSPPADMCENVYGATNGKPAKEPKVKRERQSHKRKRSPSPELREEDYPPEMLLKPNTSYLYLIYEAIANSEEGYLSLPDIYKAISRRHPYFKFKVGTIGWQSSVRHNLSQHKSAFEKVPRGEGRGQVWRLVQGFDIEKEKKKKDLSPSSLSFNTPNRHSQQFMPSVQYLPLPNAGMPRIGIPMHAPSSLTPPQLPPRPPAYTPAQRAAPTQTQTPIPGQQQRPALPRAPIPPPPAPPSWTNNTAIQQLQAQKQNAVVQHTSPQDSQSPVQSAALDDDTLSALKKFLATLNALQGQQAVQAAPIKTLLKTAIDPSAGEEAIKAQNKLKAAMQAAGMKLNFSNKTASPTTPTCPSASTLATAAAIPGHALASNVSTTARVVSPMHPIASQSRAAENASSAATPTALHAASSTASQLAMKVLSVAHPPAQAEQLQQQLQAQGHVEQQQTQTQPLAQSQPSGQPQTAGKAPMKTPLTPAAISALLEAAQRVPVALKTVPVTGAATSSSTSVQGGVVAQQPTTKPAISQSKAEQLLKVLHTLKQQQQAQKRLPGTAEKALVKDLAPAAEEAANANSLEGPDATVPASEMLTQEAQTPQELSIPLQQSFEQTPTSVSASLAAASDLEPSQAPTQSQVSVPSSQTGGPQLPPSPQQFDQQQPEVKTQTSQNHPLQSSKRSLEDAAVEGEPAVKKVDVGEG